MAASPSRRWRSLLLIVGTLLVIGIGGYQFARRYKPQWFDHEQDNRVELDALRAASLTRSELTPSDAGSWQWFGPNRDGRAPSKSLRADWEKSPPTRVWSTPCGGGFSSIAVVQGRVYTQDRSEGKERILALDAATGQPLWIHDTVVEYKGLGYGSGPRATPTIHDGRLYALGAMGTFLCLNLPTDPTGKPTLAWQHDLMAEFDAKRPNWGFASSPLIEGDLVIVQPGGSQGSIVAFDRKSGEVRWRAGTEQSGYSSPVVATIGGSRQIVALTGESLLGLRPESGELLWRYDWRTEHRGNIAAPIVVADYVFVSSSYAKGCALVHIVGEGSKFKAEQVYFRKARVMQNHHATSIYRDGFLYGFDNDTLRCVDFRKGEIIEGWNAKGISKGNLILVGDQLLGLTQTGTLFLADADPDQFTLRGKLEGLLNGSECWAVPVVVDGRIYLRDGEKIVCYDAR